MEKDYQLIVLFLFNLSHIVLYRTARLETEESRSDMTFFCGGWGLNVVYVQFAVSFYFLWQ